MITKTIKWIGPEGYTAKVGPTKPGQEITLDEKQADDLVAAGLAEPVKSKGKGATMVERPVENMAEYDKTSHAEND